MLDSGIFDELIVLHAISNASKKALDLIYRRMDLEFRRLREQNGVKIDEETIENVKIGMLAHLDKCEFIEVMLMS